MAQKRILTGDRPTGKLHLGHYVGSLQNRVKLQDQYDTFILIADIQALTTHFEHPELIKQSIYEVAIDNLAVGLDPNKVKWVWQSHVPAIAELTIFYFCSFYRIKLFIICIRYKNNCSTSLFHIIFHLHFYF